HRKIAVALSKLLEELLELELAENNAAPQLALQGVAQVRLEPRNGADLLVVPLLAIGIQDDIGDAPVTIGAPNERLAGERLLPVLGLARLPAGEQHAK